MGRSKTVSDLAVLDALLSVVEKAGPDALTFAKAAAAAGLSAATLVQRFGTRDAMIEAVLVHAWNRLDAITVAADAEAPLTPTGAISLLMQIMPGSELDHSVTDGMLLLREDLRNPVLRARGCAWGDYLARALGRRLTKQSDVAEELGWQMLSMWQGAVIWWAFKRDADPEEKIGNMLNDWCQAVGIT